MLLRRLDLAMASYPALLGALALYFLPAVTAGSLVLNLVMVSTGTMSRGRNRCLLLLGLYPLLVTLGVAVVLRLRLTDTLKRDPEAGLLLTLLGTGLWLAGALLQRQRSRVGPGPAPKKRP